MVKKLDLEKCIWKHMSKDKNSTTKSKAYIKGKEALARLRKINKNG